MGVKGLINTIMHILFTLFSYITFGTEKENLLKNKSSLG